MQKPQVQYKDCVRLTQNIVCRKKKGRGQNLFTPTPKTKADKDKPIRDSVVIMDRKKYTEQ